jgi:dihydroxyacetone kinase-like protein
MFNRISEAIAEEKDYLTELDGAIGDADHGITMSLGFSAVASELARTDIDTMTAAKVMTAAAATFLDAAGASTGPLYATGFLSAAKKMETQGPSDAAGQVAMLRAITLGIQERGKGQRGDKTMLDAWMPAADAAEASHASGSSLARIWRAACEAGETGANATQSMIALRGRAARLGERSLGHIDPGAASAVAILKAMRATFEET